ncbi:MAG: sulfotransferase [Xanthomonadaceae bacterium]|nr:sulfotransferase [Xanthomonadaceae bacterium]MDE2085405.1 sulfotransferase [Xanthomonadaceae bacterium]
MGSPRSGTSILTWALGQHPNILPTEEAPGRGPFAVAVGVYYGSGSGRGARSQFSAMGIGRDEFHAALGDAIDRLTLGHRAQLERLSEAAARDLPAQINKRFAVSRGAHEPKRRWVDGTPESSFYICGLNRLFPQARFVHILRDVRPVAASMLGFRHNDGSPLVQTAEEACDYWLRATQACLLARRALGPEKVYQLHYPDLIANPESALRGVCRFLGEEFAPACVEPLAERINSSHLENADVLAAVARAPNLDAALALGERLREVELADAVEPGARAEFEALFENAIEHARHVDDYHEAATTVLAGIGVVLGECGDISRFPHLIADRSRALAHMRRLAAVCAVALAVQWAAALAVWISTRAAAAGIALGVATAAIAIYLWLRRAGLRVAWRRFAGKNAFAQRNGNDDAARIGKMQHLPEGAQVARAQEHRACVR